MDQLSEQEPLSLPKSEKSRFDVCEGLRHLLALADIFQEEADFQSQAKKEHLLRSG